MNRRIAVAAGLALMAGVTFTAAQTSRRSARKTAPGSEPADTFVRVVSFSGQATIAVSTGAGYVHIYPSEDAEAHVTGHVHVNTGWSGDDAEARVRQIVAAPPIAQAGSILTIGPSSADADLYRNVSIDYDVRLPRTATVRARTGSGAIEVGGIDGAVSAETGSGSIHADNLGANARLETASGSIRATNIRGAAQIETGSGDLDLRLTAAGDVRAETGSGSIHIDGVAGGLKADSGSGSIEVAGTPTAEWRLQSGSGAIRLNLPQSARFNLNAETGSGEVEVDRPMVTPVTNKRRVAASVNGGGPTLRATTGSGSITIR